jgi:hypothetical protein
MRGICLLLSVLSLSPMASQHSMENHPAGVVLYCRANDNVPCKDVADKMCGGKGRAHWVLTQPITTTTEELNIECYICLFKQMKSWGNTKAVKGMLKLP